MLSLVTFTFKKPLTFKIDLPDGLRVGDRVGFNFPHTRVKDGRKETILILGEARVSTLSYIHRRVSIRVLHFEWVGEEPTWRSVKKAPPKSLAPAKASTLICP